MNDCNYQDRAVQMWYFGMLQSGKMMIDNQWWLPYGNKQRSVHGQIWTFSIKLNVLAVDVCAYVAYETTWKLFNTASLNISISAIIFCDHFEVIYRYRHVIMVAHFILLVYCSVVHILTKNKNWKQQHFPLGELIEPTLIATHNDAYNQKTKCQR